MHIISDFCNRITQAVKINIKYVIVQRSNLVELSLFVLYKCGYVAYFTMLDDKHLLVRLKYYFNNSVIRALFSINKPSLRFSVGYKKLQKYIYNNFPTLNGFAVLLTKQGLILDLYCILLKIGGFPLWGVN